MGTRTLLALIGLLLAGSAEASPGSVQRGRTCTQAFRLLPYLSHPTATGIRVNMVPENGMDLRVSFALPHQTYGTFGQVVANGVAADTRTHLVAAPNPTINTLSAGTQYKYLVECRTNATSPYRVVQKAYFRTLHTSAAANTKVAFISDDHHGSAFTDETCIDPGGLLTPPGLGGSVSRSALLNLTFSNVASSGADLLVNMGDNAVLDAGNTTSCGYTREDGSVATISAGAADDQTEQELRWEVFMHAFQPIMAFLPAVILLGNHESVLGYNISGVTQALSDSALLAYQNTVGNYNDAYPIAATDFDADTVADLKNEGLYYELATGSFRLFVIDTQRYTADTGPAGAVPAAQFAGFVARTADQPAAVHPSVPSTTVLYNGTDSYEDNVTMGGEETGWLIARAAAKTEAFGMIASHKTLGGISLTTTDHFYSRGLISTRDDDGDGKREVTESMDPDGDGDVQDEKYVLDLMVANGIQIRGVGHDHQHTICRKSGRHYIEMGQPSCSAPTTQTDGGCLNVWNVLSSAPTINLSVLRDVYDCNEDGSPDYDPINSNRAFEKRAVINEGITGANGTTNRGFGLLTVTGNTAMDWEWRVTHPTDLDYNNDRIITYGPIVP